MSSASLAPSRDELGTDARREWCGEGGATTFGDVKVVQSRAMEKLLGDRSKCSSVCKWRQCSSRQRFCSLKGMDETWWFEDEVVRVTMLGFGEFAGLLSVTEGRVVGTI
ncbi:hypothetical protein ACFX2I_031530 [Malus domestica]